VGAQQKFKEKCRRWTSWHLNDQQAEPILCPAVVS